MMLHPVNTEARRARILIPGLMAAFLWAALLLLAVTVQAQTYATPELKARVEAEMAEKYKRMGLEVPAAEGDAAAANKVDEKAEQARIQAEIARVRKQFDRRGIFKLEEIRVVRDESMKGCDYTAHLESLQREMDNELARYERYIDWQARKHYMIKLATGESDFSDISHLEAGNTQKVYGSTDCGNWYSFRREGNSTLVFTYPFQDAVSQGYFAEYVFKK